MKNLKKQFQRFLKDESGQGAIEYVLLVVVIVAIVVLFRDRIRQAAGDKMTELQDSIMGFSGSGDE